MIEGAERIETAADDLKARLARIVEDGPDPTPGQRADAGYNPNRDYHGRFAPGPHHDHARVERVRGDAAALARASGHHDHLARGEHEAHVERQAISHERQTLAAGHIAPMPTARLAEYDAAHGRIQHGAAQRQAHLDEHQARAAEAVARLRAHPEHEQHDVHDPVEAHEQASEHLGRVAGRGEDARTSYETGAHEDHGRGAAYRDRAAAAQAELEQLHGQQVRAADETRQALREHDRAASRMYREADHYEEHGVAVAEDHRAHADAARAAATLSSAELTRREEIAGPMAGHLEEAHGALVDAARATARTVRDLAKITGRAPQLAEARNR